MPETTLATPAWVTECERCECGLVGAPPLTGIDTVAMERLGQAKLGLFSFCSCKAGMMYERCLKRIEARLVDEAKRHPMMMEQAARNTHPDIDNAMNYIVMNMPAPTVHGEVEHVR